MSDEDRHVGVEEETDLGAHRVPLDDAVASVFTGGIENSIAVAGLLAAAYARDRDWATLRPADAPWAGDPSTAPDPGHPSTGQIRPRRALPRVTEQLLLLSRGWDWSVGGRTAQSGVGWSAAAALLQVGPAALSLIEGGRARARGAGCWSPRPAAASAACWCGWPRRPARG